MLHLSNVGSEHDAPEAGADVVDLGHVSCLRDIKVVYHLYEVVVVEIPRVKAVVENGGEETGSENGTLLEELPPDEMNPGKPFLPCREDEE